jgi:uncharacterized RDD family membrane protein YckC
MNRDAWHVANNPAVAVVTQHSSDGPVPASLSRRLVARLIDLGLLVVLVLLIGPLESGHRLSSADRWLVTLVGLAVVMALESMFLWLWAATPGKRLLGLRVVGFDGAQPAFSDFGVRALVLFGLLYLPVVGQITILVVFVTAAADEGRRTWWDRASGTQVVANRRPVARAIVRTAEGLASDPNLAAASQDDRRRPRRPG